MPPPSVTLNCRLLCACGCAYYIDPITGRYAPPPSSRDRSSPVVGYEATPTPFEGGPDQIDAVLVGENPDGIIVACRGTLPPSLHSTASMLDWLDDFTCEPESAPGLPGKVHTGFYDAVHALIGPVIDHVKQLNPTHTKQVYVTGHSKGGAMASIAAYLMHASQIPIAQVVTFASPKPGDSAFQASYQQVIGNQLRYENYDDLVPLLPPSDDFIELLADLPEIGKLFKKCENWDYQPVGTLAYIERPKRDYRVIGDEPLLMTERLWHLAGEIVEDLRHDDFSSFAEAHTLACGYGYISGTCPASVCRDAPATPAS
ncbi:MAG: lipase family protein [Geminicoccaceae bacterium]